MKKKKKNRRIREDLFFFRIWQRKSYTKAVLTAKLLYHTYALLSLIRPNCVVIFAARFKKKHTFPRIMLCGEGAPVSGVGFRVRVWGSGFRVGFWGSGLQVDGFGFECVVWGWWFVVWGFGLRVAGLGFGVWI